jgi:hypothetical protein
VVENWQLATGNWQLTGYFRFFAPRISRDFHSSVALSMKLGRFASGAELAPQEVVISAAANGSGESRSLAA